MKLYKHLINLARFKLGATRPTCGPMKVQWELTYSCNLKCRHCQIWKIPPEEIKKNTLNLDQQKKILDDLVLNDVGHVSFSGGEMFLQKTVFQLIAHAKSLGMKVGGNSNAYLINPEIAEKIAESGLDMLYISIDGDNAGTHDYIRGVDGAFDKALDGVRNMKKAKPDIKIFFNTTINNLNVEQLTGIARIARERGIEGLTIEMTNTFDKYSPDKELILSDDKLPILREQIKELFKNFGDLLPHPKGYFDEFETYLKQCDELYRYRCVAGVVSAQIHPNGDLYPCPVAFKKIGNLTEKSFKELWYSDEAGGLRKDIKQGRHPICWITCVSPLNQYLSYLTPTRFYKLLQPKTVKHILKKI
ncbi:MAG TPA: radical SAM protein [Nitrospirae bacterium]|nr:radical SAM protein [Nitrospirota bacterium]